jgi:hypothetical protein
MCTKHKVAAHVSPGKIPLEWGCVDEDLPYLVRAKTVVKVALRWEATMSSQEHVYPVCSRSNLVSIEASMQVALPESGFELAREAGAKDERCGSNQEEENYHEPPKWPHGPDPRTEASHGIGIGLEPPGFGAGVGSSGGSGFCGGR